MNEKKFSFIKFDDSELESIDRKLGMMKTFQILFDQLAEELSIEMKIPVWRVHSTYNNTSEKIIPEQGKIIIEIEENEE